MAPLRCYIVESEPTSIVTDPNSPDYTSEDDFDEVPYTIEYGPQYLPFMQEEFIDILLPRKDEYKERLGKFQGK
jgi:hypothetical protein